MKRLSNLSAKAKKNNRTKKLGMGTLLLLLQLMLPFTVCATTLPADSVGTALQQQLNSPELLKRLNFPKTVKRFYLTIAHEPNWLGPEKNIGPTASAMLLLDCVRQYGLQPKNYHADRLTYGLMHDVLSTTTALSISQQIEFELLLTDALISIINDLHYGAFNPYLTKASLDNGLTDGLRAEDLLQRIRNSSSLMDSIITVQPNLDQYKQLQGYLKLINGQYVCDSYETPEATIRSIYLNLERLRWTNITSPTYLLINIPSFQLFYYTPDTTLNFKVVVGKKATPTPTLTSAIGYLETTPDWKIPTKIFINEMLPKAVKNHAFFENNHIAVYNEAENLIAINSKSLAQIKLHPKQYHAKQTAGCDNALGNVVFRFDNAFGIYLHDTPEQHLFTNSNRAFSHGCVRVAQAAQLASLLLKNDGQLTQSMLLKKAMLTASKQHFVLKKKVPIHITYLTITVINELLVPHADIYNLDKLLEKQMFGLSTAVSKTTIK